MASAGGNEALERYTDSEWQTFIDDIERDIEVSDKPYASSDVEPAVLMKTIDHTLLKLDTKSAQIDDLCAEARVNGFASVCVRVNFVHQCAVDLKGSGVKVACVIGFHEGTYDLVSKLNETHQALSAGADELDIVINYPQLQAGKYASIYRELASLRQSAPHPTLLKLILETSQLNRSQIIAGCVMAAAANFDFVKTSTGFNGPGATVENVRLMRACCERLAVGGGGVDGIGRETRVMRVKAAGGVRTAEDAERMIEAGASRLGTSAGVWIAKEAKEREEEQTASRNGSASPLNGNGDGRRPSMQTRLFTDY